MVENREACVAKGFHPWTYRRWEDTLGSVTKTPDVNTMRDLNSRADLNQEEPIDVARDFLQQQGLI